MGMVERGNDDISTAEAASLLQWWNDAGVDCLVDEAPRDWLRVADRTDERPAAPVAEPPPAPGLPDQLELFHTYLRTSEDLPFAAPGMPRLCPSGDPASGAMVLTDMPTGEDCDAGILLSGEAGQLFERMLAAIGRSRDSIYLAALSCLRSPARGLDARSAAACADLARHHIGLVAPKACLLLGDTVSKALLGMTAIQARGQWHSLATPAGEVAVIATFHPNYLLDRPADKRHAWLHLQQFRDRIGQ